MVEQVKVNGAEHWYKDGKLHRDEGPAIICHNGDRYWYRDGTMISCDCPSVLRRPLDKAIVKTQSPIKNELYPAKYLIIGVIVALIVANIVAHFL